MSFECRIKKIVEPKKSQEFIYKGIKKLILKIQKLKVYFEQNRRLKVHFSF